MSVSDETLADLRSAVASCVAGPVEAAKPIQVARFESIPVAASAPVAAALPVVPAAAPRVVVVPAVLSPAIPAPPKVELPAGDKATRWAALQEKVLNDKFGLAQVQPGKKIVFGTGSLDAKIFFCGDTPGEEEELAGEPFVGPAGQLLTRMIQGMGVKREQVYIGYSMNWRPEVPVGPGGVPGASRRPTAQEMAYCRPYLQAQIEIVQPDLIVALGATAAGGFLGADSFKTLGEVKGRWHEFGGRPLMVTYHPSYILQNNTNRSKRGIWEDLMKVMERVGLPVSEKQRQFYL